MTTFEKAVLKAIWAGFRYLSESSNRRPLVEWVGEHSETGPAPKGTAYPPRTFKDPDPPKPGEIEALGRDLQAESRESQPPPADNPGPPKRKRGRPRKNGTG